ncbi:specifically androgen-regulated gene protein [Mesoplodon densirostris]|uniref:specifically androgen-regulated gene protein n=1 Tax=Mesoplodon densirostris TaxID=48708 RepID=UPI0028DC9D21|nr:specifically androgen-regulated gene protein [Mesoplodon densirostris]
MPERELWPAGPGLEPVTRIGSCDSMMSTTSTLSGSSDSSYDFLSAEEKECLLFLEETIGSLDTEADSGLSTDKSGQATTPRGPRTLPTTQPAAQGHPKETVQQGTEPKRVTPFSLSHLPEPQSLVLRSGSYSLPRNIHISRNQILRKSTTQTNSHIPGVSDGLVPGPEKEQVGQSSEPPQAPTGPRDAALNLDRAFIPPPEAFRDTQPEQREQRDLPREPGELSLRPQVHTSLSLQQQRETTSEAMSQKANEEGSPGEPGHPRPPPAVSSQNAKAEDVPVPSGGDPNARLTPLTAPKPRKLPPNIFLKSSRGGFHSDPQNRLSCHSEAGPRDSGPTLSSLQEQRRARREALEKLGLPQDQDEASTHLSRPSIRLRETRTQAPSPAPASPVVPAQVSAATGKAPAPAPMRGPSPVKAPGPAPAQPSSPGNVLVPAQEPAPGKVPAAKSMPIPIPTSPRANSPLTQPKPDSGLTLQESSIPGLRQMNFKSNTLERSGLGLSSYLSAEKDPSPKTSTSLGKGSFLDKISPNILRNSRPRPASLGTRKDFEAIQVGKLADPECEQGSKRLSYQGQSRDRLPRPPGVSVKISPKGVSDEQRKEALKKLGLLRK